MMRKILMSLCAAVMPLCAPLAAMAASITGGVYEDAPALALPEMIPTLTGIKRISRRAMAAPSAGSARVHEVEQAAVIAAAFAH